MTSDRKFEASIEGWKCYTTYDTHIVDASSFRRLTFKNGLTFKNTDLEEASGT